MITIAGSGQRRGHVDVNPAELSVAHMFLGDELRDPSRRR